MLDFCIETITSDRLTLSSPMVKRLPKSADAVCEALTESSAPFRASAKLTLAAGISVWIIGTLASGRVAADFSCAIIASILLLSIPPVFTLPPRLLSDYCLIASDCTCYFQRTKLWPARQRRVQ